MTPPDNEFVIWNRNFYPVDGKTLPLSKNESIPVPDGPTIDQQNCTAFHKTFGYDDGSGCNRGGGPQINGCGTGGCCSTRPESGCEYNFDKQSVFAFMLNTGFNLGRFIEVHYFSVPESEKAKLCKKAGLEPQCFSFTHESWRTFYEQFSTENPWSFKRRFIRTAVHSNGYNSGPFEPNRRDRIAWESAFSLDLITSASTNVTKKVQGDWVISRIEFDPTLICKYAKPTSDFYTH